MGLCSGEEEEEEDGRQQVGRGRGTKRCEGVVPGSTNQRQDAIDRHVARGLVQRIPTREGGG